MANHGGPTSLPRAHRPRALIMSVPPLTAPLAPLRPAPPVTLTIPRPENERATNEYVETPFRAVPPSPPPQPPRTQRPARLALPPPLPLPVTKQPGTASFSKEPLPECATRPSIMCPECGRCRCESCQQPRPLPQKWVCNNSCLVSADSVIDYASCLCCVKGLFLSLFGIGWRGKLCGRSLRVRSRSKGIALGLSYGPLVCFTLPMAVLAS
ncbi:hypothetical protein NQ314_001093 [Rhamnusium bicolor]|uniref:Uncharacterized protein n=1 Tax=Rhamnusium bicolor TaxID=1586634 RepID=A0AAV8ZUX1_9CUCU|nr:hypothetical protein NQ314_001093 [Rhamnusium bicolor]